MNKISTHVTMLLVLLVAAAGLFSFTSIEGMLEMNIVKIVKDKDDVWRVRDLNSNENRGTMVVNKNDQIQWKAQGSDMHFIFTKPVDDYFEYEEGVFEDDSTFVENNGHLRVTIKKDAPSDTLEYKVWVVEDSTYVVAESHPKVIVK